MAAVAFSTPTLFTISAPPMWISYPIPFGIDLKYSCIIAFLAFFIFRFCGGPLDLPLIVSPCSANIPPDDLDSFFGALPSGWLWTAFCSCFSPRGAFSSFFSPGLVDLLRTDVLARSRLVGESFLSEFRGVLLAGSGSSVLGTVFPCLGMLLSNSIALWLSAGATFWNRLSFSSTFVY